MSKFLVKTWSRFMAVQVLYQIDFNERMGLEVSNSFDESKIISIISNMDTINKNLLEFKNFKYSVDMKWLVLLLESVFSKKIDIDKNLSEKFGKKWSLERMDSNLLSILRCGCAELFTFNKIPAKVIISEYTNISSSFFNNKEIDFVNGILDSIAKKIRPNELN